MKIKEGCRIGSSEFWYDLNEGYIDPSEMLEDPKDAERVLAAIKTMREFEESCEAQIPGFCS